MAGISDFVRCVFAAELRGESDADLLTRFIADRDESAFTTVIRRHGLMVYRVCRSVLRNEADAEDAAQATFLVLAQKAANVRKNESLPSWLHGVALRTARKLRASIAKQQAAVSRLPTALPATAEDLTVREASALLNEELERLPARYKTPLVLCYLQGKTHDEAAAELGWTLSVFRGRLERARTQLRDRLSRRRLSLAEILPSVGLTKTPATLTTTFAVTTSRAATAGLLKAVSCGLIAPRTSNLTQEVIRTMGIWNIKLALAASIAAITLIVGGSAAYHFVRAPLQTAAASPEEGTHTGDDATADNSIEGLRSRLLVCQSNRFGKIKPDGSGLTEVGGKFKDLEYVHKHRVSPDGKSLAFQYETRPNFKTAPGMVIALWAFDEPWPGKVLLTEEPPTAGEFYTMDFFWMPVGKQLVLCKYQQGKDLVPTVFKSQMLDVETLKVTDIKVPDGHRIADISADGKWFLTVKDTDPKKADDGAELYRVERSTGEARMIFDGLPTAKWTVQWRIAPDGTKVAGIKFASARWFQLFVGDVATGKFDRVTHEPNMASMFYGWSRDGKKLLYSIQDGPKSPGGEFHLTFVTVDADGKNRAELYRAQGNPPFRDWVDWR